MSIANYISLFRIILIPFFIMCVFYSRFGAALVIFSTACFSDAIDGYIARVTNQRTKLGAILDPIADKLLLGSAFICLSVLYTLPEYIRIPPYVIIIVLSRDAIILIGYLLIHYMQREIKIEPCWSGKCTTVLQMMTIIAVLAEWPYVVWLWNVAMAFTVFSGARYLHKGIKVLNECV